MLQQQWLPVSVSRKGSIQKCFALLFYIILGVLSFLIEDYRLVVLKTIIRFLGTIFFLDDCHRFQHFCKMFQSRSICWKKSADYLSHPLTIISIVINA